MWELAMHHQATARGVVGVSGASGVDVRTTESVSVAWVRGHPERREEVPDMT